MDKKKTALKGFTLIELIIVLAIFSVIMTLVMSFIDPVSKIMTKTSVRERTSAYVDNINEYVSKSIRHAQNIWIYEHGLNDTEGNLVTDFVNTYYDGALHYNDDGTYSKMKLKVHVLKLINKDEGTTLKAGHIYETVYDMTAGKGYPSFKYLDKNTYQEVTSFPPGMTEDEKDAQYIKCEARRYDKAGFESASVEKILPVNSDGTVGNEPIINDEHFKDYSFYYRLGMYDFVPITDSLASYEYEEAGSKKSLTASDDYFYSKLVPRTKGGSALSDGVDGFQLVLNVISFQNKTQSVFKTNYDGGTVAFKSPAAMNSDGITFKNIQLQKTDGKVVSYYRYKIVDDGSGNYVTETEDGQPVLEPVRNNDTPDPFRRVTVNDSGSDNIYMIFTVPSEIDDTEWNDSSLIPEPTTAVPGGLPVLPPT